MNKLYDLIILGAGPAGITASVYAARKKLDFLVITVDIGGQAAWSSDIENYTGYQFITGPDLTLKFQEHLDSFGIEINMPEGAQEIVKSDQVVKTVTDKGEYQSKSLIVATGKHPRPLNVEGENEYKNRGVTYCATCDGPLFQGKKVAVIGGGNSALDATLQMMNISPEVHMVNIAPHLTGDQVMIEKAQGSSAVKIWNNAEVKKIYGDMFVKGLHLKQQDKMINLDVEGVFIEIGLIPNAGFARCLEQNKWGEIVVDCYNKTSIEGIFAAGDVTNVPEKQIIVACGEGSKASLAAFRYLSTHKL